MDKQTKIEALIVITILTLTLLWAFRYEPINCAGTDIPCRMDRWTGRIEWNVLQTGWREVPPYPRPSPETLAAEEK